MGKDCILSIRGRAVAAHLEDFSAVGARFRILSDRVDAVTDDDLGEDVVFVHPTHKPPRKYTGELIRRYYSDDTQYIALRFWKARGELPEA